MSSTVMRDPATRSPATMTYRNNSSLPLVVTLNCIEDTVIEQQYLAGIARVEHVPLSLLAEAKIESAAAVLLHSLAFLPRAAQRRLRPWQIVLCLGSADRTADSAIAVELGLGRLVHVDVSRAEEVADTVMALFLGLLRRTHLLSRHALSASGWLGSVQPLCRGMRRCRGLVLGIIGRSASAKSLATRSLAFRISVLYYDVYEEKGKRLSRFPPAARRMDTLNDLLAATYQASSSQLLDDCAVKQLLIDGTLAGCALDGAEGPQWMEAWITVKKYGWRFEKKPPLYYKHSSWMMSSQPMYIDEEENETLYEDEQSVKQDKRSASQSSTIQQLTKDIHIPHKSPMIKDISQPQESTLSQNTSLQSEVKHSHRTTIPRRHRTCRARASESKIESAAAVLLLQ